MAKCTAFGTTYRVGEVCCNIIGYFYNNINPKECNLDVVHHRLFSIGCNRIESWNCYTNSIESNCIHGEWKHGGTTTIESSSSSNFPSDVGLDNVCTLSSDVLCLVVCDDVGSSRKRNIVAVGGVDGRLHFYYNYFESKVLEYSMSIVTHKGRINALSYDSQKQIVFSGSHDGFLSCWLLNTTEENFCTTDKQDQLSPLAVSNVASHCFQRGTRVTTVECLTSTHNNSIRVLSGTQNGTVHLFSLEKRLDSNSYIIVEHDFVSVKLLNDTRGEKVTTNKTPIINALCMLPVTVNPLQSSVLVGHAHGVGILTTT